MGTRWWWMVAVAASCAVAAAHASTASAAGPPCSPSAARAIVPLVVEEEGPVSVNVSFDYACRDAQRPVNLVFLQNGADTGEPQGNDRIINENYERALAGFLSSMDRSTGPRAGYTVFANGFTRRVPLTPLERWPAAYTARLAQDIDTAGLLGAMRDAATQQASSAAAPGADNVIVIVLTSARPLGTSSEQAEACAAVRRAGARVALVSIEAMRGSGGLGDLTCIDWFLRTTDGQAADLGTVFDDLARAVLVEPQVTAIEVADGIQDAFRYVERSASPREPDTRFGGEVTWLLDGSELERRSVTYRVKGATGWSDVRIPLSVAAKVTFSYSDGSTAAISLANPRLCIHARRDPSFCLRPSGEGNVFLPVLARRAVH